MFKNHKSILSVLFIASSLIIMVSSGYCSNNELTSVNDVDSISLVAYKKSNTTLYVSFLYKNHKTDQLVFWRGVSSNVSCDVYELVGDRYNKQKGRNIGSISQHSLTDFNQGVYIDVVMTNQEWGLVSCGWTFGGHILYGEEEFLQRKSY